MLDYSVLSNARRLRFPKSLAAHHANLLLSPLSGTKQPGDRTDGINLIGVGAFKDAKLTTLCFKNFLIKLKDRRRLKSVEVSDGSFLINELICYFLLLIYFYYLPCLSMYCGSYKFYFGTPWKPHWWVDPAAVGSVIVVVFFSMSKLLFPICLTK